MVDLSVTLAGVTLKNPVIPASGTFGYGREFSEWYDLDLLGSFSWKGTTRDPRSGNPQPRVAEAASGMLNAVGLQNPGMEAVLREEVPNIARIFHGPVIANVCGFSLEEYAENCRRLEDVEQVKILEINISCPNVKEGGIAFGQDPKAEEKITTLCKAHAKQPVIMKLRPNVTDITVMAKAAEAGGADAISLINTLTGMKIDVERRAFALANKTGGLSGPAIKPVAVRMVYQAAGAVKVPIIGMGGIWTAEDALEFILAGATAVAVGTANFHNPYATVEIVDGIRAYMERHEVQDIRSLIGAVH